MGALSTVDGGQQGLQIGFVRPVANVVGASFHQGLLPRLIGGGILLGNGLEQHLAQHPVTEGHPGHVPCALPVEERQPGQIALQVVGFGLPDGLFVIGGCACGKNEDTLAAQKRAEITPIIEEIFEKDIIGGEVVERLLYVDPATKEKVTKMGVLLCRNRIPYRAGCKRFCSA